MYEITPLTQKHGDILYVAINLFYGILTQFGKEIVMALLVILILKTTMWGYKGIKMMSSSVP